MDSERRLMNSENGGVTMEQLKGILNAFLELIEKLVGDNESLKGIIDTLKKFFADATEATDETAGA